MYCFNASIYFSELTCSQKQAVIPLWVKKESTVYKKNADQYFY